MVSSLRWHRVSVRVTDAKRNSNSHLWILQTGWVITIVVSELFAISPLRSCNSNCTLFCPRLQAYCSHSFSVSCICTQILSKSPWERKGRGNIFAFYIFSHCFTKQINFGYHWKEHSEVESICPATEFLRATEYF